MAMMQDRELLAERFEEHRSYLRAVAYRMLGSVSEAEDAVQEAWFRAVNAEDTSIRDLRAWLTTVVGRICLDMLRARRARKEYSPEDWRPDPIVEAAGGSDPEAEVETVDSIGLALLVVLETLTPSERLAFVLHDVFGVEFDEIAAIAGKSPAAARQLASRARRRVRQARTPDADLPAQRKVVEAFLAASRAGDFEGLVAVLDPDVIFRLDRDESGRLAPMVRTGATAVARQLLSRAPRFAHLGRFAVVNGAGGVVVRAGAQVIAVVGFTIEDSRIVSIDLTTDPAVLRRTGLDA
jgi:RNA polymerase sigma-70 factor (ECF subfamily)